MGGEGRIGSAGGASAACRRRLRTLPPASHPARGQAIALRHGRDSR